MKKSEFTRTLVREIREQMPIGVREHVKLKVEPVRKMNAPELHGLIFETEGCSSMPVFYIEDLYEHCRSGITPETIAGDLVHWYLQMKRPGEIDAGLERMLNDYAVVKDCTALRLLSVSRNRKFLEKRPYCRVFEDLVLICDIRLRTEDSDEWRIPVDWDSLRAMGVDTFRLFREALDHARIYDPPVLYDLSEMAAGGDPENLYAGKNSRPLPPGGSGIYVLSTKTGRFGASVIGYPGIREELADHLGGSFYLLPSSIHELLLVPSEEVRDPSCFAEMVRDANRTVIPPKEILSDSVYYHDAGTGRTSAVS